MEKWHEDDRFWEIMAPFMFSEEQWRAATLDVDLIIPMLFIDPGAAVLDLGCGPGRHSLELARRGFAVTGVDRTAAYLNEARRRAAEQDLAVEFVQADMRQFSRPDAFAGAINLFTTFGYFEDPQENKQVLVNVHQSLQSGGVLVMEMTGKEILARVFQQRDWQELNGILFLAERKVARNWSWMENRWIKIDGAGRHEYRITHWLYSAAELTSLLMECGFGEVMVYGDLERNPYDHTAKRLVVSARK
jgi:SAM-dependent methyltransferase